MILAPPAVAQRSAPAYEAVLIPFANSVRTGSGIWFPQVWFRNDGDVPADIFPLGATGGLTPPPEFPSLFLLPYPSVPPRSTPLFLASDGLPTFLIPPIIPVSSATPGAFVYVERNRIDQVSIGGSLVWASFAAFSSATELPIVRTSRFRSGRSSILGVSVEARERYSLRIFAHPESFGAEEFTVRVFNMQPQNVSETDEVFLFEMTTTLRTDVDQSLLPCAIPCEVPAVPFKPAFAELFSLPTPLGAVLRIELEPAEAGVRYWAVVSATHNDTNQVEFFELR